jgi:hypothetical protein
MMNQPITALMPRTRSAAIALLAATLSLAPLAAFAGEQVVLAQNGAPSRTDKKSTSVTKDETLEQRIATLKASMKITPDETDNWNAVAAAMRTNAAAMDKLVASKQAQPESDMTALDDLMTYQAFAQARVDGLANLTASFTVLYNSMPDAQKKLADQVFRNFGRRASPVKG